MQSLPAGLFYVGDDRVLQAAAQMSATVETQLRGRLVLSGGALQVELVAATHPTPVRVVMGEPTGSGAYRCTISTGGDMPGSTITVSPVNAPGVGGLGALGTPDDAPASISHTGDGTMPAQTPTITAYPGLDETEFNDLIVVPPLESGDKPIYVMLSRSPRKPGVPDPDYRPNKDSVGNMGEFFNQPGFGSQLKVASRKTTELYKGQPIYTAIDSVGDDIIAGDKFYLDSKHKYHLEVFSKNRKCKAVLNLDGSRNRDKTIKALSENRTIPK